MWLPRIGIPVAIVLVLLIGGISGATRSMGWGLDSRLDDRLLRLTLENFERRGVPWSDDELAIGMWCWVTDGHYPVHDAPARALLGGRLVGFKQLGDDLRDRRQFRYLREDGSAGGWWVDLRERDVSLLLVSANDTRLLRALSPTIWQPLLLDSPVILCARAGDAVYQEQLLRALSQREFVEYGPWQYAGAVSTNSDFDRDRWGLTLPMDARRTALRQARVFRAIGLPIAGLRVLNWLRHQHADQEPVGETLEIQRELAHREFIATGAISPLRIALTNQHGAKLRVETDFDARRIAANSRDVSQNVSRAAGHYVNGELAAAEQILADEQQDERFVRALLRWEYGQPDQAVALLRQFTSETAQPILLRLAQWWLELLQPSKDRDSRKPNHGFHESGHGSHKAEREG